MLLDARGHLKLTDLGLCKKVGEVSPMDNPDVVLKMLREQGVLGGDQAMGNAGNDVVTQYPGSGKHRDSGDAMAMSIDDSVEVGLGGPAQRPTNLPNAKTRREVSTNNHNHIACFLSQ
jgi:hypothetical protein